MVYDFAAFVDSGLNYNQMSMFPDFVQPTDADQDFYFDDIRFLDAVAGTTDPVITEPPREHGSCVCGRDGCCGRGRE